MNTYIIVEAGVNHNGDLQIAKQLVHAAHEAGADAVKFQTFRTKDLVTESAKRASYQRENTGSDASQADMLRKLELSEDAHKELLLECEKLGIEFMSSPFDVWSAEFLARLGVKRFKIGSGEITNLPLLRAVGSKGIPVIFSTGMATLQEVKEGSDALMKAGVKKKDLIALHCHTNYPTDIEDVNLRAMETIRKELRIRVGYSDHTRGIEVPIAATALGAEVIEKHFTLSRNMPGPDHKASLEPNELKIMISAVRQIEIALGSAEKVPTEKEKEIALVARKSIVATKRISAGDRIEADAITSKRPADGISPMHWDQVIGTKAIRDFELDECIEI